MGIASTDFVYGKARALIAAAGLNWSSAAINAMLVNANYAPSPNTDQYVSTIPSNAIVIRDIALTSLAIGAAGQCAGLIPQFLSFASVSTVVALVLYVKGANDGVSPLIYYTSTGSGFPFQPQGFNYVIGYDQANGGFFQA